MSKSSELASKKVEKSIHEMKEGKLRSGSGKKVTSRKQAIAIGLSEAREAGAKIPKKSAAKKAGPAKKEAHPDLPIISKEQYQIAALFKKP